MTKTCGAKVATIMIGGLPTIQQVVPLDLSGCGQTMNLQRVREFDPLDMFWAGYNR